MVVVQTQNRNVVAVHSVVRETVCGIVCRNRDYWRRTLGMNRRKCRCPVSYGVGCGIDFHRSVADGWRIDFPPGLVVVANAVAAGDMAGMLPDCQDHLVVIEGSANRCWRPGNRYQTSSLRWTGRRNDKSVNKILGSKQTTANVER